MELWGVLWEFRLFGFSILGLEIGLFKVLGYNRFWVLDLFRGLVRGVLGLVQFGF